MKGHVWSWSLALSTAVSVHRVSEYQKGPRGKALKMGQKVGKIKQLFKNVKQDSEKCQFSYG